MSYSIYEAGNFCHEEPGLDAAVAWAAQALTTLEDGELTTFTVEDRKGNPVAAVTNQRIQGTFIKQSASRREDAIYVGEEHFDATDAVLLLSHKELMCLRDNDQSTDRLGQLYIDWNGPCHVCLEDAICDYFGVEDITDISPELLAFARNRAQPQEPEERTLTLTVKVKVRVHPGSSVDAFVANLDYAVTSCTPGVVVCATEIVEAT